jgi:hypothetical protein
MLKEVLPTPLFMAASMAAATVVMLTVMWQSLFQLSRWTPMMACISLRSWAAKAMFRN